MITITRPFERKIYDLASVKQLDLTNKKIGLLGGSFNPPHLGHIAISKRALELGLDYIIWLVVPQNPLKKAAQLSVERRAELGVKIIGDEQIIVSTLEAELFSNKPVETFTTINYLIKHFPATHFFWIMGVDCLKDFHKWDNFAAFPQLVSIILYNRKGYEEHLTESVAGKLFKPIIVNSDKAAINITTNQIIFIPEMLSDLSSTALRAQGNYGN